MNWLQKIAAPIKITPEMDQFADNCLATMYHAAAERELRYNEIFFSRDLKNFPGQFGTTIPVSVIIGKPEESKSKATAETPSIWRANNSRAVQDGWESHSCYIRIYETIPPRLYSRRELKKTILHELIHCVDPKLSPERADDPNLFKSPWVQRHNVNSRDPDYVDSPAHYTAPWEQDAFMSSEAFDQVSMWHRNGVSRERALQELHFHMPDNKIEEEYKKDEKLWHRYMRALAEAYKAIYGNSEGEAA